MNHSDKRLLQVALKHVIVFTGIYLIGMMLYSLYLAMNFSEAYFPDPITHYVAEQSAAVLRALDYPAFLTAHQTDPVLKMTIHGKYLVRIMEGCNGLAILILNIAFIVAFAQRFKNTLLYLLATSALLYAINIVRIALISTGIYHFPTYTTFLHEILFPLIIYGTVLILWWTWIKRALR